MRAGAELPLLVIVLVAVGIVILVKALVSISHLREYEVGTVILEGKKKQKPTSPKLA